ncbi:hypothetical protein G9A89_009683 [Geosiphon pyriformis]|nr:hypothetical protein G9A89_009683 [Geosiphon pyriformis]
MDVTIPVIDDTAARVWTFSHSFPLPFRVLIVLCIGLWAWGSNLQLLSCVGRPCCPLGRRDRIRFMRCFCRIMFFKFGSEVRFADTVMADILTSFAKVLGDLYVTGCILIFHNFEEAGIFSENRCWSYVVAPFLTGLPYFIRFRLCMSEYWSSNFINRRHLYNALKYASAFPVIFFSALQKRYDYGTLDSEDVTLGQATLYKLWIASVAVNSLYSFYWDVTKDWNLEIFSTDVNSIPTTPTVLTASASRIWRIPSFQLRSTLHFKFPFIYYIAIIIDFLLRFTWSLKLSSHLHVVAELEAGVFLMECLEVGRRWLWMFFRMESRF